jgi:hypothetical protein
MAGLGRRPGWRGLTLLLAGALLAGCDDSPFSPGELREVHRALARWEARGFTDYRFEAVSSCFCAPEVTRWARVEVRGGAVVAVRSVETGELYPSSSHGMWATIEDRLAGLLRARTDNGLKEIVVRFDPVLGFPTVISHRYDSDILDAGGTVSMRNVAPLD